MHLADGSSFNVATFAWGIAGAVIIICLCLIIRYRLQKRRQARRKKGREQKLQKGISLEQSDNLDEQKEGKKLTHDEIQRICEEFAIDHHRIYEEARMGILRDWFCPICLHGHHKSRGDIIELPCSHRMHSNCIENSFEKGLTKCGVCGWDARSLFNKAPADGDGLMKPTMNRGLQTPRVKDFRMDIEDETDDDDDDDDSVADGAQKAPAVCPPMDFREEESRV